MTVRPGGARRVHPAVLQLVADRIVRVTPTFDRQLDALATEVARGNRKRSENTSPAASAADRAS